MKPLALFILKRFVSMIFTLLIVSILVFVIIQLPPGDFAERYAFRKFSGGSATVTPKDIQNIRKQLGLDKPKWKLYCEWMKNIVFHFDFGPSFAYQTPVKKIIKDTAGYTIILTFGTLILVYLIALPLGSVAALKKQSFIDYSLSIIGYAGLAVPPFLLALLLLYFLTIHTDMTVGGFFSNCYKNKPWTLAKVIDFLKHISVPIIALAWSNIALQAQTVRALMSDEINKHYVIAAQARGVPYWKVIIKYPFRMSLNPVVGTIGFDINRIFSDLPIVAIVLNLPELGQFLINAYLDLDMYLVGAILLLLSFIIIFMNFLSDILLAILDPRIKIEE